MNYSSELKKFLTSQYIYSGARIALAIVFPVLFWHNLACSKNFSFSTRNQFRRFDRSARPIHQKKKYTIAFCVHFFLIALIASLVKDFPLLFIWKLLFWFFFSMIGVYGLGLLRLVHCISRSQHLYRRASLQVMIFSKAHLYFFLVVFGFSSFL
jgi:hypothetical protein